MITRTPRISFLIAAALAITVHALSPLAAAAADVGAELTEPMTCYKVRTQEHQTAVEGRGEPNLQTSEFIPEPWSEFEWINNPKEWPFSAFVKLEVRFDDSSKGECSGTLIHQNWILTAAHCVYQIKERKWAIDIEALAGYREGAPPLGDARGMWEICYPSGWPTCKKDERCFYDYAIVRVKRPQGASKKVRYHPVKAFDSPDLAWFQWHNAGYPNEGEFDGKKLYYQRGQFGPNHLRYSEAPGSLCPEGMSGSGAILDGVYDEDPEAKQSQGKPSCISKTDGESNCAVGAVLIGDPEGDPGRCLFARLDEDRVNSIKRIISDRVPKERPDLVPLDVGIEQGAIPGKPLPGLSFTIYNNSLVDFSEDILVFVWLADNPDMRPNRLPLERPDGTYEVLFSIHGLTFPAAASRELHMYRESAPVLPESLPPGLYYLGVELIVDDHDPTNNLTTGTDAAVLQIGGPAAGPPA